MSQKLLLKVLNGLQSGAEVALDSGDYVIGSGSDDDLQIRDISLKSGHARLRIGAEGAEIKAEAGDILLANGGGLEAGEDRWVRLEPLAVFVLGTTRISIGPPEANWASISEDEEFRRSAQVGTRGPGPAPAEEVVAAAARSGGEPTALEKRLSAMGFPKGASVVRAGMSFWSRHPRIAAGASSALVAIIVSLLLFRPAVVDSSDPIRRDPQADRIAIERAVASLPFTGKVRVRQEVDGQIIVRGIIGDAAERRALMAALEATKAPFRPRLSTSEAILTETRNLLGPLASRVKFMLREDGVLSLNGFIPDPAVAAKVVETIRNQVSGPTEVETSRLKTGADLVADVTRMARDEGIGQNVVFSLAGNAFIEATGAVPSTQVDAWVSVLINYGDLFSDKLPLRSLVQLVNAGDAAPRSGVPTQPVIIGNGGADDGRVLDVQRLRSGRFSAADIFAQESLSTPGMQGLPGGQTRPVPQGPTAILQPPRPVTAAPTAPLPSLAMQPLPFPDAGPAEPLAEPMKAIQRWASDVPPAGEAERRRFAWFDRLLDRTFSPSDKAFKAGLLARAAGERPFDACRETFPGDAVPLHKALVWLDLLSTIEGLSIKSLDRDTQLAVAEVMLSPQRARDCMARIRNRGTTSRAASIFLAEASVNPDFVLYLVRDVQAAGMRLSGARTESEETYVVDVEGRFLRGGMSIDRNSRIWSIGEIGIVTEKVDGIEVQLYDRGLAWLSRRVYDPAVPRPADRTGRE